MGEVDIAEEFSGIEGLAVFEAASPEAGEGLRITAQRAWSQNLEEVRGLATECQERYNRHWRLEKPGFRPPRSPSGLHPARGGLGRKQVSR